MPPVRSCSARAVSGARQPGRSRPAAAASSPRERDPLQPAVAVEGVERRRQRVLGADLGRAVGDHDEQRRVRRGGDDVPEQRERRAVGVVQVLERDEQRPLRRAAARASAATASNIRSRSSSPSADVPRPPRAGGRRPSAGARRRARRPGSPLAAATSGRSAARHGP